MTLKSLMTALLLVLLHGAGDSALAQTTLPPGPGVELVTRVCSTCHDLSMITDTGGLNRADWESTLEEMQSYGAEFTAQERLQILNYLATFVGPKQK